jgi:transcriptional regulator PpsR
VLSPYRPTEYAIIDQQVNSLTRLQPDVTLLLDRDGVILEATLSQAATGEQPRPWLGRHWAETLASLGSDQLRRFLADATETGVAAFGPVTQTLPSGRALPMEYTAVRLGPHGNLLAVGKCVQAVLTLRSRLLAAQRGREHDYWRLREVETRYRQLFDSTNDAVVMLDAESLHIADANPAALRNLGFGKGHDLLGEFAPQDRAAVTDLLGRVRAQGRVPGILVHLGAAHSTWTLRASLVQNDRGAIFQLQFARAGAQPAHPQTAQPSLAADAYIDRLPDGFVITDRDGTVRRANPAFLDLAQARDDSGVLGQSLGSWLRSPGLPVLMSQLERYGTVQGLVATLTGGRGAACEVEISAAGDLQGDAGGIGLVLRPLAANGVPAELPRGPRGHGLEDRLAACLGAVPLGQLVQEATEAVERQCIEAALERCRGNRSAAALLLGVSRQSFYVKLHRYGVARPGDTEPAHANAADA